MPKTAVARGVGSGYAAKSVIGKTHIERMCDAKGYSPYEARRLEAVKKRSRAIMDNAPVVSNDTFEPPVVRVPETESQCCINERCLSCGAAMLIAPNASYLQCPNCRIRQVNMDPTITSFIFGGEPDFAFGNAGKMHHFEEALKNIQAKGGKKVPAETIQKVIEHVAEEQQVTHQSRIERHHIHTALKELGFKTLYALEPQIYCRITNEPPPFFDECQEQVLKTMFSAIQAPYQRAKDKLKCERKTFFPYAYCIYKFLQILNWTSYMKVFGLLPQKKKLVAQEDLFRLICLELGWTPFVPLPAELLY